MFAIQPDPGLGSWRTALPIADLDHYMTTRETHKSDEHLRTSDRFVFRELIRLVVDNLWFIVGVAAAVTLLAGIYCIFASPVYSADALVQVAVPKQNALADLVSKQP